MKPRSSLITQTYFLVLFLSVFLISGCSTGSIAFHIFYARDTFLTILKPENPRCYFGYRIVEDRPVITNEPLTGYLGQPNQGGKKPPPESPMHILAESAVPGGEYTDTWKTDFADEVLSFSFNENGIAYFRYRVKEYDLTRVSAFRVVEDGLETWMWLETDHDISGSFIVQQCLRFSGQDNEQWRHSIALIPELSEFDLWNSGELRSLSFIRQDNQFKAIEPIHEFASQSRFDRVTDLLRWDEKERGKGLMTTYYTNAGLSLAQLNGGKVDREFEIPHGLIVRESVDGKTAAGMYWEHTAKVSNHHPADCLHSYVDLGPVSAGERNVVRGKIYYFEGTKEDLLNQWKRDFPH